MGNQEFVFAHWATEKVIARIAGDVPERRQTALFDPAAGTKKIIPVLNRKIRKALRSEARSNAVRPIIAADATAISFRFISVPSFL